MTWSSRGAASLVLAAVSLWGCVGCGGDAKSVEVPRRAEVKATTPIPADAKRIQLQVIGGDPFGSSVQVAQVIVGSEGVRVEDAHGKGRVISNRQWQKARKLLNTGLAAASQAGARGCYEQPENECWFHVENDGQARTGCCTSALGLAVEDAARLLLE